MCRLLALLSPVSPHDTFHLVGYWAAAWLSGEFSFVFQRQSPDLSPLQLPP